ncbi:thioredoxin [Plakobranchus ocellatus]|uniref:Thioredoxin n=1 Tax=Plakobranchus ocellatus TaxID=259542 RepID=A0AAV4AZR4_9GAST|nr:thioredoxin [Plakobranchus ocellatus]
MEERVTPELTAPESSPREVPSPQKGTRVKLVNSHTEFMRLIQQNSIAMVKFHAKWCGPCKSVAPEVDKMSLENPDVTFLSVDVDLNTETADECDIDMLPTFLFYIGGKRVEQIIGSASQVIREKLSSIKRIATGF